MSVPKCCGLYCEKFGGYIPHQKPGFWGKTNGADHVLPAHGGHDAKFVVITDQAIDGTVSPTPEAEWRVEIFIAFSSSAVLCLNCSIRLRCTPI